MTILFLQGGQPVPGGVKPIYLKDRGHEIINPALPDDDFAEAVRIAQAEFDKHKPQVIVGSSRGGAIAMNINSGEAKLVLLCPAWKQYGMAKTVKRGTVILHSRANDVVPFGDSEELLRDSGFPESALIEVGDDHRLADPKSLEMMLAAFGASDNRIYNHRSKAGNQGDVVKHISLIAALDSLIPALTSPLFRYADLFAGYPTSTLGQNNRGNDGWGNGVGSVITKRKRLFENRHLEWWATRYLPAGELFGTIYPGSAAIASDVATSCKTPALLGLWDTSSAAVCELRQYFGSDKHTILNRAATPDDDFVLNADFLFIDPPGIKSKAHPEYPAWGTIRRFIELKKPHQSLLMWLPIKAVTLMPAAGPRRKVMEPMTPSGEDSQSWLARNEAVRLGCRALRVRWARGGRTIGCHLIYSLPLDAEKAMRLAVEKIVAIAGWCDRLPNGIQSVIL